MPALLTLLLLAPLACAVGLPLGCALLWGALAAVVAAGWLATEAVARAWRAWLAPPRDARLDLRDGTALAPEEG